MDIYTKMAKQPVFSITDVNQYYGNVGSARSAVKRLMAYSKALKIRNDLYTCVSAERGGPVADRFQVASAITDTSCISHHSALEYYGTLQPTSDRVYVSSRTRFQDFSFAGCTFHFVRARLSEGVSSPPADRGVRVTDIERTVADSLKDLGKIGQPAETVEAIGRFSAATGPGGLDEERLLRYLELYSNQFLYQKAGFLLGRYRASLGLSDNFFSVCRDHIGKSKRYLSRDRLPGTYNDEWKLIVPSELWAAS